MEGSRIFSSSIKRLKILRRLINRIENARPNPEAVFLLFLPIESLLFFDGHRCRKVG